VIDIVNTQKKENQKVELVTATLNASSLWASEIGSAWIPVLR